MDMEKAGKYLAFLRHSAGLTQEELGERIGVTNKTVSRWETGKYLPPAEMLVILSEFYGVTINEILSGRELSENEYRAAAEENIRNVLSVSAFDARERLEFFKTKWKKDHLFEHIIEAAGLAVLTVTGFLFDKGTLIIAVIAWSIWWLSLNNRMLAYAENRAFDVDSRLNRDSSTNS